MLISIMMAAALTGGGWTQVGACSPGACRWHEVGPVARVAAVPVLVVAKGAVVAGRVATTPVRRLSIARQVQSGCASGQCGVRRGLLRRR